MQDSLSGRAAELAHLTDLIQRIRYALPRHKRGTWIGTGRKRKSSTPDAQGFILLSPHELLDRLADLVPPPRKHRHRYHGVFAPNHRLRKAVTGRATGATARPVASLLRRPPVSADQSVAEVPLTVLSFGPNPQITAWLARRGFGTRWKPGA